jgi:hypothetical protein
MLSILALAAGLVLTAGLLTAQVPTAVATVRNPLNQARPSETVVVRAAELRPLLAIDDLRRVRVQDAAQGRELLTQAVDLDDDGTFDELVFQADLAPGETRTFSLSVGERRIARREDYRAYGRFVRERRDDFAWENDRVAHRMYGQALETWAQEPLTSSGIDVWVKRTPRLVINDWYLVDDYHRDTGEGADLYSVGRTRGCGGNAPWIGGRLAPSNNFRRSRVIANGPIRVMFELVYEPWDANGVTLSEVKRITLDAGHHLNRFESRYTIHGKPRPLQQGVGIRRNPASVADVQRQLAVLRTWEPFRDAAENGHLGCGVILDPAVLVDAPAEADGNVLLVGAVGPDGVASYYAGSAWDRGGYVADVAAWDARLAAAAARVRSPVEVAVRQAAK